MPRTTTLDPRIKKPGYFVSETNLPMINSPRLFYPFTGTTPEVTLDKKEGTAFILGRCLCSNPHNFFKPMIEWAQDYVQNPQQVTTVIINGDYINTGSSMALRQFLGILAHVQFTGRKIIIKWYCDKADEETCELITMIEEIIKVKIQVEVPE
jgi:hypothetical protein